MPLRGFILHPTYRIEGGGPVVHLFGRLEGGASFLVRDDRLRPYFFVRAADADAARAAGAAPPAPTDLRTMRGEPVVRIEVATPPDTPPLRDRLAGRGIPVYEADVRFAMRYLIDGGIRGSLAIEVADPPGSRGPRPEAPQGSRAAASGPAHGSADRVFENPVLTASDWSPAPADLRVVSLDIETDPRGVTVYSAALAFPGGAGAPATEQVLLALPADAVARALRGSGLEGKIVACGDEEGLIAALFDRLRALDFDVLTGWNVIDFDLAVLVAAARRLGVPFEVGRLPGATRVVRETSYWGRSRADIAGRMVLDGIDLLKGAFVRLEDYRLDTAARAILGEGKVEIPGADTGGGKGKAEAITRAFREDLPRFVAYNLADARLVLGILEKARLIELSIRRSLLTGMPLDRVGASIASFDSLYLRELRRRGHVAPSVGGAEGEVAETLGGAVLEPAPGIYDNVLAFDFRSLYPSLIRTFNIDPLGYVPDPGPEVGDLIRAPNGACFRREPGILPDLLRHLFPQREAAKRRGDAIGAHAIKILMNSCYGVLATPACRFYSAPVANAITHFGQWALYFARDRVEALGHRVLYGDTDSLFVLSGLPPGRRAEARRLGEVLRDRINQEVGAHIARTFRVESHLELEFETLFLKYFLPAVRHGTGGARKRYAGLVEKPDGGEEVIFVGMEVVRRDWTELSKVFQRGLFERLFRGTPRDEVAAFTRGFIEDLRRGAHDGLLVYRKALRKELDAYTATTPPHVKAARKQGATTRGLIEYVVTTSGPEPAAAREHPPDYEHYVEKQVRPIAEQVLPLLGLSFEEIAGGRSQMRLFE